MILDQSLYMDYNLATNGNFQIDFYAVTFVEKCFRMRTPSPIILSDKLCHDNL